MPSARRPEWDEAARRSVLVRRSAAVLMESAYLQQVESGALRLRASQLRREALALRAERKAVSIRPGSR